MIIATALIAFSYILGSVAIQFIASPEVLQKAEFKMPVTLYIIY